MTRFELGISGIRSDCSTFCTIRAKMLQMVHSCQLFVYFPSFSTKVKKFTAIKYEKCPSSIQCWYSNPRPSECESSPITTSTGLLSKGLKCFTSKMYHYVGICKCEDRLKLEDIFQSRKRERERKGCHVEMEWNDGKKFLR